MTRYFNPLLFCGVLFTVFLSGCMTDATVELTKAPFDATTALTDGSSKATGEILDPLTELTSSTTPGASIVDPLIRARQKTEVFASYSYEHLRSDIARGSGEYLVSFATAAGIPPDRHTAFQDRMRDAYATLFDQRMTFRESTARMVDVTWAEGFGKNSEKIAYEESLIPSVEPRVKKHARPPALSARP